MIDNISLLESDTEKTKRELLGAKLKLDIDNWSTEYFMDDHRWHLGASAIGGPCDRALWYTFRWATQDSRKGRMKRLHERGKEEEVKINRMLRGIGCTVHDLNPETGKQWVVSWHKGHYGGSMDGELWLPPSYNDDRKYIGEYKTSATGAVFNNYSKKGVADHKPNYFIQHSTYGYGRNCMDGLFIAVNKNDDDLHIEPVKLSVERAEFGIRRAANIITTDYAPARISNKSSYFECVMCDHKAVCHGDESLDINCRSCVYAEPTDNAQWKCNYYGQDIPKEFVPNACPKYKAIA